MVVGDRQNHWSSKFSDRVTTVLKVEQSCLIDVNGVRAIAYLVIYERLDKLGGGGRSPKSLK
jgi:hypothetical protein